MDLNICPWGRGRGADRARLTTTGGIGMSTAAQDADQATLKPDAIGILSNIGVGVAATTPGVSVALVFGLLAAGVGVHIPGVVLLGFVPILLISGAYFHLNKADPD